MSLNTVQSTQASRSYLSYHAAIRLSWIIVLLLTCSLSSAGEPKLQTLEVHGPAIIAFFPPVTDAELAKDGDTNEALVDFQFYAAKVREQLSNSPIAFHEIYGPILPSYDWQPLERVPTAKG